MDQFLGALEPIAMVAAQTTDVSSQAVVTNDYEAEQLDVEEEEEQEPQELEEDGEEEDVEHEYCLVYDDEIIEEHDFLKLLASQTLTGDIAYEAEPEAVVPEENDDMDPVAKPGPQNLCGAPSLVGKTPSLAVDDVANGEKQELCLQEAHNDANSTETLEFNCDKGKVYSKRVTRGFLTKSQEAFFMEAFLDSMIKGMNNTVNLSKGQYNCGDYDEEKEDYETNTVFKVESMPSLNYEFQEGASDVNIASGHKHSVDASAEDVVADDEAEQVAAGNVVQEDRKLARAVDKGARRGTKPSVSKALNQVPLSNVVTFKDSKKNSADSKSGACLKPRATFAVPLALPSHKRNDKAGLDSQIEAVIDEIVGIPKVEKLTRDGAANCKVGATSPKNKRRVALPNSKSTIATSKNASKAVKPKEGSKGKGVDEELAKQIKMAIEAKLGEGLRDQKTKVKEGANAPRVVKKVIQFQKPRAKNDKANVLHTPILDPISLVSGVFDEEKQEVRDVNDDIDGADTSALNDSRAASEVSVSVISTVSVQVRSCVATPRSPVSKATSVCATPPPPLSPSSSSVACDSQVGDVGSGGSLECEEKGIIVCDDEVLQVDEQHVIGDADDDDGCNHLDVCSETERVQAAAAGVASGDCSRRSSLQEPPTLFYGYYQPCSYAQGASRVNGLRRYFQADAKCQAACRELGFDCVDAFNNSLNAPSEVIIKAPECFGGRQRVVFKDHVAKSLLLRRDWIANTVFQINWNMYRRRCSRRSRLSCCNCV